MSRRSRKNSSPTTTRPEPPNPITTGADAMPAEPELNELDVRRLRVEELPEAPFPGGRGQDFRIAFTPEAHRALWAHALETTAVEICGVLVGRWANDADGPFVSVTESIRGEAAESKLAEVTFTHQTWSKINAEMDEKFSDLAIVGWYHTHPDFGVFLSERDVFIQQHFFSGPGQIAHVIDPIRRTEGVFIWKDGKPALTPYFWVGGDLKLGTAAGAESRPEPPREPSTNANVSTNATAAKTSPTGFLPPLDRLLAYLCLFLIGYLIASAWSAWDRMMLIKGVVADYGVRQGLRPGLSEDLDIITNHTKGLSQRAQTLAADHLSRLEKDKDKNAATIQSEWRALQFGLAATTEGLTQIKNAFGMTPEQTEAAKALLIQKLGGAAPPKREPPPSSPSPNPISNPTEKTPAKPTP